MICLRRIRILPRSSIQAIQINCMSATADSPELPASFVNDDVKEFNPRKFDKSGLLPQHKNLLHELPPYDEPHSWIHQTEKYQRKLFGRYGSKSRVNPRICFDSKTDQAKALEIEHITQPETLQEMLQKVQSAKSEKLKSIQAREDEISKKMEKLEQWKADLNAKVAKREADALAAKERKERLIEEVRRHFGFKVDPKDERFKEMLEQKEKEDKRNQKAAKRKAKEEKMMAKLIGKDAAA